MLSWIGRVVHAAGVGVDDMEKPQVSARASYPVLEGTRSSCRNVDRYLAGLVGR